MQYKLDEPRVTVRSPYNPDTGRGDVEREIGQGNTLGEAEFFRKCGYRVGIYRWNGKMFENSCTLLPEDGDNFLYGIPGLL